MIPALVLTAGLATRLRPLSFVRAKAALPVAGEPLVRRILRQLHAAGVRDAVLNLHHLPHTITGVIGDGTDLGLRIKYSWEMPVLGSAGGPRQALDLLGVSSSASPSSSSLLPSSFLIINGDTLTNVDITGVVADHRRTGALVTMAVVPNRQPDKYSGLMVDADGAVTGVARRGATDRSWHFVGVQVAEARAFASVPAGAVAESVRDVYPALIRDTPGSVRAWVTEAEFFDIGTPGDYLRTSLLIAAREDGSRLAGTRTRIAPAAHVEESVLWDDVEVEAGAVLERSVAADGVRVPGGTSWVGVTLRRANGELAPGERVVGALAVASI